jgi:glycerophosphoryl diester phosphodiesterase
MEGVDHTRIDGPGCSRPTLYSDTERLREGAPAQVQQPQPNAPRVVAHRGNAADFPENTLPALASALGSGLPWIEIDVQLSADGVPFVIHDARLERTTREVGDLRRMTASELSTVDAGEPWRFGDAFAGTPLPRLADLVPLLGQHEQAGAFIELKRASLMRHGREVCVQRMLEALDGVADRCVPISFDQPAVRMARAATGGPVGWVIERFNSSQLDLLQDLRPEFVFYDYLKLSGPDAPLTEGPWRWVAYEIKDATQARIEFARGAALVESMAPLGLAAALQVDGLPR